MPSTLMVVPAGGDGKPRSLRELRRLALEEDQTRLTWIADSSAVILRMYDAETVKTSLFRVPLDGSQPVRILKGAGDMLAQPSLSPDGNWLAYVEEWVLYVRKVGSNGLADGPPIKVLEDLVIKSPTWRPDSSGFFLLFRGRIMFWDLRADHFRPST